ncbi:alpha/beta hydrolase [Streptomyces sp. ME02-6979.5a]|uniref:alpha/beta fold hydrolase n=1 Tax=Streptomyces sp. ME02-6979.5a TaxID=462925 RepID=UPI0029AE1FC9|nr:alpha/beta hydrolase [Streptomyces sp. ME02-6979.5a]MDX3341757.1 alpha/beta hydrolase [Streptomyces sp. ME02-6979.5a]
MSDVRLSAGVIEYRDTGGDGPVVVLLHGVAMDGSLWDDVVAGLGDGVRCIVPTLPLGGHRRPMEAGADLSVLGVARLVAEFLEALRLEDVTLVMNDWGGAQALVADGRADRIGRLVITSCEAFDNYPPGLPGRNLATLARVPGGLGFAFSLLRLKPARRLPMTWGWMSKRPVPHATMDRWFRPAQSSREIRRDLRAYVLGVPVKAELLRWTEQLRTFDRPALVIWATEDRVMPVEHGRRLAEILPRGRLVEVADSYTLLPRDRPDALVEHIGAFLAEPV